MLRELGLRLVPAEASIGAYKAYAKQTVDVEEHAMDSIYSE